MNLFDLEVLSRNCEESSKCQGVNSDISEKLVPHDDVATLYRELKLFLHDPWQAADFLFFSR